jgi:hypothetical protein
MMVIELWKDFNESGYSEIDLIGEKFLSRQDLTGFARQRSMA